MNNSNCSVLCLRISRKNEKGNFTVHLLLKEVEADVHRKFIVNCSSIEHTRVHMGRKGDKIRSHGNKENKDEVTDIIYRLMFIRRVEEKG